jgi:cysteine-rich repeat protein
MHFKTVAAGVICTISLGSILAACAPSSTPSSGEEFASTRREVTSSGTPSDTANCTGWTAQGPWGSPAYGVATVTLVHCSAPAAAGTPCTGTIVEVDQATACLNAAGTLSFSGNWQNVPLDGFYQAWFNITVYSSSDPLPNCPLTATQIASWPSIKTFSLPIVGEFSCTPPPQVCGDGILQSPEQCDDGNSVNGDGCEANCTLPVCGNGIVDQGEQCDDGNSVNGDGCEANCTLPACGNGILDQGEQCDDGNSVNGDGCEANCTLPSCGNGILDQGEQCDDGNSVNGDGCESNCTTPSCGNGILDQGEQCDDGNNVNGDGCEADCKSPSCGNGIVDQGEQCDLGPQNGVAGSGCTADCKIAPPPPSKGCTFTIGYWKTHNIYATNASQHIAWPISENTQLCGHTWLQILQTPPNGNAWYILAQQWIGAELNVASGASTTPAVQSALSTGQTLLSACSISSADRAQAIDLASLLNDYNNGYTGPGHCN